MATTQLLHGDCRTVLQTLADQSVQTVVTSPPYWGLRDYGTGQWDGGDLECSHIQRHVTHREGLAKLGEQYRGGGHAQPEPIGYRYVCGKCGATRIDNQIGLEQSPGEYVAALVAVFREVRRVLRDDGTLWLNLGDSYAGSWGNYSGQNRGNGSQRTITTGSQAPQQAYEGLENWRPPTSNKIAGLKNKDLVGIPWRVAFALQDDGWYLRSDIIWSKPNPMPESVTDRPTKAHEYLFLFAKSERYFYNADAIREPHTRLWDAETNGGSLCGTDNRDKAVIGGHGRAERAKSEPHPAGRNKRTVWTIATRPYAEAHFATFPEALVEPCILAGSRAGDTVLDPFGGSGTVGKVAARLQRSAILIELNRAYIELQEKRTDGVQVELFV